MNYLLYCLHYNFLGLYKVCYIMNILVFQFKNMFDVLSISMINEEILKFVTAVEASRRNFTNKTIYNNADCKALFVIVITGQMFYILFYLNFIFSIIGI